MAAHNSGRGRLSGGLGEVRLSTKERFEKDCINKTEQGVDDTDIGLTGCLHEADCD